MRSEHVYMSFLKNRGEAEGMKKRGGSRQMTMEKAKAICSGWTRKFKVMGSTFSTLKWEKDLN